MKKLYLLSLSLWLVMLSLNGVLADDEMRMERNFEVPIGGTLKLTSDLGSIEILTWDQPRAKIEVVKEPRSLSKTESKKLIENFQVDFEQKDTLLEVTGAFTSGWKKRHKNLSVHFKVQVPEKFNLKLQTSGGSISVADLEGKIEARTSGGSLSFASINGPVWAQTSGGSISLKRSDGDVDLRTSGGSISLGEAGGKVDVRTSGGSIQIEKSQGNVQAKTSGGSITVQGVSGPIIATTSGGSVNVHFSQTPSADCRLETSGGSVNVWLPEDVALNIDARTSGGKVICDFEISAIEKKKEDHLRASIRGGGPELFLRTSGGNIHINQKKLN